MQSRRTAAEIRPEVGFKIPRPLFQDNLDGLLTELKEVRFILRTFCEAATGQVEPIVVTTISTSDPTFFFGLPLEVIIQIGRVASWALAVWKDVEEIRKLRADAKRLRIQMSIEEQCDAAIKAKVKAAVDEQVAAMIGDKERIGRQAELATQIDFALNSILARIERGMTVEIKIAPRKEGEGVPSKYKELVQLDGELTFPPPSEDPVLALPRSADDSGGANWADL